MARAMVFTDIFPITAARDGVRDSSINHQSKNPPIAMGKVDR
ncbi:hypothetical protein [Synechocystis sp. FACHB-383]|nr:hypothetical protein [Synechocystis sp. FACHB-383]